MPVYPEAAFSHLLTAGILHGLWHNPLLWPQLPICPLNGAELFLIRQILDFSISSHKNGQLLQHERKKSSKSIWSRGS